MKIESNREDDKETYYMGRESLSRTRYHEKRRRRESQRKEWHKIRRDSQGRDFYQERRGRNDSRGRPFFRRYYRENQGFLEISQGIWDHIRDIEMIEKRMRIGVNQEREVVIEI